MGIIVFYVNYCFAQRISKDCLTGFLGFFFFFFFVWIVDNISGGFFLVSLLLCASVLEHVLSRYLVRFLD
jgi:hypothetical protein